VTIKEGRNSSMLKQNNSDTKATIQEMKENHPNKVIKE